MTNGSPVLRTRPPTPRPAPSAGPSAAVRAPETAATTAAWPPASTGAMNAKSPPASSRARSVMRWSITAWSSVEVSSRPIASSASASCRRRSPSAATRSRSMATAARSAMLPHSAASVAPSAGPSRRPTSSAPIGSPAWTMGVATQEVRASRRGSVAQAPERLDLGGEHGRPPLEGQGGRGTVAQGELQGAHQPGGTAVARDQPQARLAVDPQEDRGQVGAGEALAMAATCAIASWTEVASSRPRKAARAPRSLVLMSSPERRSAPRCIGRSAPCCRVHPPYVAGSVEGNCGATKCSRMFSIL